MIRIAIVDDEEIFVKQIHSEVEKILSEKNVEFEISDYTDGRKLLEENEFKKFDLVLLDIDMPEIGGFEIAEKIYSSCDRTQLVFVSSYENLVFDSIKYSPFRFIRKNHLENDAREMINSFVNLFSVLEQSIELKTDYGDISLQILQIQYIESNKHDIFIYSKNKRFKLKREKSINYTLKKFECDFKRYGFIKAHKSFLVNFRFIKSIEKEWIQLKNMEKIPISINRYMEIRKEYLNCLAKEKI